MRPVSTADFPGLAGLDRQLRAEAGRLVRRWQVAREVTERWATGQPDLLGMLREQLGDLPPAAGARVAAGSRETTTHFAWRLVDDPDAPFSLWLHEYKPQHDWWPGYANSVHNHRYHFCSIVLTGCLEHEWYDVRLDPAGERVVGFGRRDRELWRPGRVRALTAEQFHRVARARDGTVTFLVKSRPVRAWSLSVDPASGVCRRHVPVEERVRDLASRI